MVPVRVFLVMVSDCANVRVRERVLAHSVSLMACASCYAAAIEIRGSGRRNTSRRRVGCAGPWRAQSSVLQTHSVAGELLLARRSRCGCCVNAFRCAFCQGSCGHNRTAACRDEGDLGRGAPRPEWLQMYRRWVRAGITLSQWPRQSTSHCTCSVYSGRAILRFVSAQLYRFP
jgi:hypothetical protein